MPNTNSRRARKRVVGLRREKTAKQLHRAMQGEHWAALDQRWQNSPLYNGEARPRRVVCSRLRELELHPDRLAAIRARP